LGSGNDQAKQLANKADTSSVTTLDNSTFNPLAKAGIDRAGTDLQNIQAGKFGSLPLVQAVNQAANRLKSWNPAPMGDAALAAGASGQGGYATAEDSYRRRLQDRAVSDLMPQAVEAERNYSSSILYPGAQGESAYDLAKAAGYAGAGGQAANLYNLESNNGFWNHLTNSLGQSLGQSLGGVSGSYNSGNGQFTGGFG